MGLRTLYVLSWDLWISAAWFCLCAWDGFDTRRLVSCKALGLILRIVLSINGSLANIICLPDV